MNQDGRDPLAFLNEQKKKETLADKSWRKFKEDPAIPIFFGLTCVALVGGLRAMGRGDKINSNRFMRMRVVMQTGCLGALLYAGTKGRLIVDKKGKRTGGPSGNSGSGFQMPPGIPPPPTGE
mmetsp:Transcript_12677/g.18989  ORF Transcript_12677/g.18989 Transcript_12677/m.18989 type:complete len:122 (-) Transcript_12677:335-700(-)|eukprot:CAMPEP_0167741008 /NCGR_PEP_ID=MMETSP0110_2-20121227/615_1 /TAXON_ID=629695 /ORGANISM="Gymnochlora sp., Strain CCMP2014" /LENGTH=121 /DNA_ID=CAMNT_0007625007 /DNA_START=53 /DNA_END=418 /DNA_ORIENTATION=+